MSRIAGARVIDENAPHGLCCDGEEMGAPTPLHSRLIDEAEIRLVHERRGLQGLPGPLAPEVGCGQATKLFVYAGEEIGGRRRRLVAVTIERSQQLGQVVLGFAFHAGGTLDERRCRQRIIGADVL